MDTDHTAHSAPAAPGESPGGRARFGREHEKSAHFPLERNRNLFDPGTNCLTVARADRVTTLVDAEAYFRAFVEATRQARESILLVGWDFDSRTRLIFDDDDAGLPSQLGDYLNHLVRARRGLRVYILNWDYPLVFGTDRETRPIYGWGWKPHRRVQLHYDNTHPVGGSHHQKIVVVDDAVAFCGGLDLTCRRWDTCAHRPGDERRTVEGKAYPPFHDVMAMVDGEAARTLGSIARARWLRATGKTLPEPRTSHDAWPEKIEPQMREVEVAVSRTVPKGDDGTEVREIEALYVDMIAAAQDYIYIENQYFTSDRVGAALAARLGEPDPPEIVVVTRLLSHGWLEEHTMEVLRTRLIHRLHEADKHGRFEVYYPHVEGLDEGTCIDVHSKVMVVDDVLLRIGSANVSNRSMGFDTECDLTFAATTVHHGQTIRDFRDGLLAEHLGEPVERVRNAIEEHGSLHAAIRALECKPRTLQVLADVPDYSDAAIELAAVADPERPVSLDQLIDEFSPDVEAHKSGIPWVKIAIGIVCVAALAAAWRFTPLAEFLEPKRITAWAEHVRGTGWVALAIVLVHTPAALTMFPRPLITLFAVIVFGPVLGLAYSLAGIMLAASAVYFIGRQMPRDKVRRLAGERLNRMTHVLRKRGILAVIAVGVVPVAPFAVEAMVAGAIRIKYTSYFLGTLIAMLPGTLATSVFGNELKRWLADPSELNYWLIGGVFVAFLVIMWFMRRWFTSEHDDAPAGKAGAPAAA